VHQTGLRRVRVAEDWPVGAADKQRYVPSPGYRRLQDGTTILVNDRLSAILLRCPLDAAKDALPGMRIAVLMQISKEFIRNSETNHKPMPCIGLTLAIGQPLNFKSKLTA